jgi:hypothetical protein
MASWHCWRQYMGAQLRRPFSMAWSKRHDCLSVLHILTSDSPRYERREAFQLHRWSFRCVVQSGQRKNGANPSWDMIEWTEDGTAKSGDRGSLIWTWGWRIGCVDYLSQYSALEELVQPSATERTKLYCIMTWRGVLVLMLRWQTLTPSFTALAWNRGKWKSISRSRDNLPTKLFT